MDYEDQIHAIFEKYQLGCYDNISIATGWVGDAFPEIVNDSIKPPDSSNTSGWHPYYIELRKLSTNDDLLVYHNDEFFIYHFEHIVYDGLFPIGIISLKNNMYIPTDVLVLFPNKLQNDSTLYQVITNITFNKYIKAANTIKRYYAEYKERKAFEEQCHVVDYIMQYYVHNKLTEASLEISVPTKDTC